MLGVDLRSAQEDKYLFEENPIKSVRLRNLSTSMGVAIGDSSARLRAIMGPPTWKGGSQFTAGEHVWSYHRRVGTKDDGMDYTALFRLRKNKIACIELTADMLPG